MFDPAAVPDVLRSADDTLGARLEDAGLSSSQPPQQSIYDGWLLRYSPGKAKRARSVNAIGAGRIPLEVKLAAVEAFYQRVGLPCLYRITPYSQPAALDRALAAAGYVAREETRVMWVDAAEFGRVAGTKIAANWVGTEEFAAVAGTLRDSPPAEAAAEAQRIAHCALPAHSLVVRDGPTAIACGQIVVDADCVGVFNMVTAERTPWARTRDRHPRCAAGTGRAGGSTHRLSAGRCCQRAGPSRLPEVRLPRSVCLLVSVSRSARRMEDSDDETAEGAGAGS